MIIACPECTQPFQVEDGDIAPLVQVECPHCVFRMILDFEAANDSSLIEAGMRMAQGFTSEAEYRSAVGGGSIAVATDTTESAARGREATPRLQAVPQPEPEVAPAKPEPKVEPEPEVEKPPVRTPRTQPAQEKPPVRQPEPKIEPTPEPEPPTPEPEVEKPPVRIRRATFEPAPEPTPEPAARVEPAPTPPRPPRESRATLIAYSAPPPALRPPGQTGVPTNVEEPGTPAPIESEVEVEVDIDEPQPTPDARHSPPHTPPVVTPIARPEFEEPSHPAADSQSRPIAEADPGKQQPEDEGTTKKPSVLATVFKVILLLLLLGVAGVMVWSLIETGNPNPLPMLQERFGITIPGL